MTRIPNAITDDDVTANQHLVRGQLMDHLYQLLELCEEQIREGQEEGRVDPRFAELRLRVLDRIGRYYRLLDKPREREEEPELASITQAQTRSLILEQLLELEARTR